MRFKQYLRGALFSVAALLAACGGGGGGTGGPIGGGDGVMIGVVTGFGSVFVNGVRLNDDNAAYRIDDQSGTKGTLGDRLQEGMVVRVKFSSNDGVNGTATEIQFDNEVEGPVSNIDAAAGTFTVLGQNVQTNGDTVFDDVVDANADGNIDVADLAGKSVEVSGLRDSANTIIATRIEAKTGLPAACEFEVKGTVANLTATGFRIGTLTVNLTAATRNAGAAGSGALVEVKGTLLVNGSLDACLIESEDRFGGIVDDDDVEIEGFITDCATAGACQSSFKVGGIPVNASSARFVDFNNQTLTDGARQLANGVKVEVEGNVDNSAGSLVVIASKVKFKRIGAGVGTRIRLLAPVQAIDKANRTLTMFGQTVKVPDIARVRDKSDAKLRSFNLDAISVGDWLEVRGVEDASGIIALRLEREDEPGDGRVRVKGQVDAKTPTTSFTIAGITVLTGADTRYSPFANATDWYNQVNPARTFVHAKGQPGIASNQLDATQRNDGEVQIEGVVDRDSRRDGDDDEDEDDGDDDGDDDDDEDGDED